MNTFWTLAAEYPKSSKTLWAFFSIAAFLA